MSKSFIIDRRLNSKGNSITNRNKFLKRVENQIKKSIPNILGNQRIKDITEGKGSIKIPIKGIEEPTFIYNHKDGIKHRIFPGNTTPDPTTKYVEGDQIEKPKQQGGRKGRKGSNDPSVTEDDFVVNISREEFLEYFFQDLALPDMTKKYLSSEEDHKYKRHGYKTDGAFSSLDLVKSYKNSLARRIGMKFSLEEKLKELENDLENENNKSKPDQDRVAFLNKEIDLYKKYINSIPYLDDKDLTYRNFEPKPVPNAQAVMFCIMDISGSMGKREKDIARRFFTLLYLFLTKQYPKVDIVFIQHHTEAKEVNEETFFSSKESGGTMILPSLELTKKIIDERYNSNWNIYVCQASDGDVWDGSDAQNSSSYLNQIMPLLQYMAYIEIGYEESYSKAGRSDLWRSYKKVSEKHDHLQMRHIEGLEDIWNVFKKLFEKKIIQK